MKIAALPISGDSHVASVEAIAVLLICATPADGGSQFVQYRSSERELFVPSTPLSATVASRRFLTSPALNVRALSLLRGNEDGALRLSVRMHHWRVLSLSVQEFRGGRGSSVMLFVPGLSSPVAA
ncbi:MAG: hypothetical protein CML17_06345 [Pusillimonas sp.]|nr:hypothetical protein [Pusillimonas sp.]